MAFHEPYPCTDGNQYFLGCDTWRNPLYLSGPQFSRGVNGMIRGLMFTTRPGFVRAGAGAVFSSGEYMGGSVYSLESGDVIVCVVDGVVYVIDQNGNRTPIDVPDGEPTLEGQAFFTQVYKWMVVQDNQHRPRVISREDGIFVRVNRDMEMDVSMNPETEELSWKDPEVSHVGGDELKGLICYVPGAVGAYADGRYHYVPAIVPELLPELKFSEDQTEYTNEDRIPELSEEDGRASVISSDVLDVLAPYYVFRLSEHRVLNEGGAFVLPDELGPIKAVAAMRGAATGTGVGRTYFLATRGVASYDFSIARTQWKDSNVNGAGIGQVTFHGAGTLSPYGVASVNDDIIYLSTEGHLRSLVYDSSQLANTGYASVSLSSRVRSLEATRWVRDIDKRKLRWASLIFADNRILWTLPLQGDNEDGNTGNSVLASIDVAPSYAMGDTSTDVMGFDGIWTGFKFLQVFCLNNQVFALARGRDGQSIHLLRFDPEAEKDLGDTKIKSMLITRAYPLIYNEASAFSEYKQLDRLRLFVEDISMDTVFRVWYRPNHMASWTYMGEKAVRVPHGTPAQSRRLTFVPSTEIVSMGDNCNPITKEATYMGHTFQFRIEFEGHASIVRILVGASIKEEGTEPMCEEDNPDLESDVGDDSNDFDYVVPLGG